MGRRSCPSPKTTRPSRLALPSSRSPPAGIAATAGRGRAPTLASHLRAASTPAGPGAPPPGTPPASRRPAGPRGAATPRGGAGRPGASRVGDFLVRARLDEPALGDLAAAGLGVGAVVDDGGVAARVGVDGRGPGG